jgi:hypothetical protein
MRSSTPYPVAKPRLDNWSSWTMGLRMRVRLLADRSTRGQRQYQRLNRGVPDNRNLAIAGAVFLDMRQ